MKDRLDLTRGWLLKGNSDIRTRQQVLSGEGLWPTREIAEQALTLAEKIRQVVLAFLPSDCHP